MTITTKQITAVAHLVFLRGEPCADQARLLGDGLREIIEAGGREIVVDISDATGIDEDMLETLAETAEQLDASGGELLVARKQQEDESYRLSRLRFDDLERLRRRLA